MDQACRQRDKLRSDLDLVEQRNLQLIREVDDRQLTMETLNESRIRSEHRLQKTNKQTTNKTKQTTAVCTLQSTNTHLYGCLHQ